MVSGGRIFRHLHNWEHDTNAIIFLPGYQGENTPGRILKDGGQLISLVGPPTPEFAEEISLPWHLKLVTKLISSGAKKKAKKLNVSFKFLFMRADGNQLGQITQLIEAGIIKPIIDRVFPFEQTNEALSYVETGRARGKVVVKVR